MAGLASKLYSALVGGGKQHFVFENILESAGKTTATRIDFSKYAGLEKYNNAYALVIDNAFTAEECEKLVETAVASTPNGWEVAQINAGGNRQVLDTSYRNSGRIILDDPKLAGYLLERVRPYLGKEAETLKWDDNGVGASILGHRGQTREGDHTFQLTTLNERLRFLRYSPGQFFKPHCDGQYVRPDGSEWSFLTFQLYLNDSTSTEPLTGGATRFWQWLPYMGIADDGPYLDVAPKAGRVLVFQHRLLLHSGEPVTSGVKMAIRTDFMYKEVVPLEAETEDDVERIDRQGA